MAQMSPGSTEVRWPTALNAIPKEIFWREDVFQRELERIFYGPWWHPVAHCGEIPERGDFKTFFVGDVPLLISRGADDEVRVFFNACSHRGNQLETAAHGNRSEFECPYHRWLFDSTGALRGCPGSDDFSPGFKLENYPLSRPRLGVFRGLIFVSLDEAAPPLDEFLGRIQPTLAGTLGEDGRLRLLGYQKVRYATNWKAYVDNDGYHPPLLHSAFRMLNWQGGKGKQYATENGHLGFESELSLPKGAGFLRDESLVTFRGTDPSRGSRIVALNPFTILTSHLDVINIRFAIARSVDETEVHYAYFCHEEDDDAMIRHRVRQSSNLLGPCGLVSMEDAAVFHRVHIGNHTPGQAIFQKGVRDEQEVWLDFKQNDEAGNLPRWESYRRVMGYARESDA